MSDVLAISVQEHVARIALDRPDKHNAVNLEMFVALADAADALASNRSVRAVVLTGAGDNFCAGIDISLFADPNGIDSGMFAPTQNSCANLFQRAAYAWRELRVPVICAVKGVCFGAGLQIALGADMRFAAADARLSIMEVKWGLIPDMAVTVHLRDIMPADRAKELAMTGRIVDAAEAFEIGLVTALHDDPESAAMDKAAEIASKSPQAVQSIKQLFDRAWHTSEADALRLEARLQMGIIGSPNQREAVMANVERRRAVFDD